MAFKKLTVTMLEADICDPLATTVEAALETSVPGTFPGFTITPSGQVPCPDYVQISPRHQRSFAATHPVRAVDEFGNSFDSLQMKGSFFPFFPKARKSVVASSHEVFGLNDHEDLGAGLQSRELRAAGLPTEHIIYTAHLKEGIALDTTVPMERYKSVLARLHHKPETPAGFVEWVDDAEFFGIARLTETGARINDFNSAYPPAANYGYLKELLQHQNTNAVEFGEAAVTIDQPAAIERLVFEAVPERMGQSTGILHGLGKVHGNLHPGNWMVSGMFLDLDTVHEASPVGAGYEFRNSLLRKLPARIQDMGSVLQGLGIIEHVADHSSLVEAMERGYQKADEPLYPLL